MLNNILSKVLYTMLRCSARCCSAACPLGLRLNTRLTGHNGEPAPTRGKQGAAKMLLDAVTQCCHSMLSLNAVTHTLT